MISDKRMIQHYKSCIKYKQYLIQHYENRGNDGAVALLEKEIYDMKIKGKKLLEEMNEKTKMA